MKFPIKILVIFILFILINSYPVFAQSLDEIKVVKISSKDERAVVKIHGNDLQVIKVGDSLAEHGRVVEITRGRIVLEINGDRGGEKVIIRLENGRQRIERIMKAGDERPEFSTPQSIVTGHGDLILDKRGGKGSLLNSRKQNRKSE